MHAKQATPVRLVTAALACLLAALRLWERLDRRGRNRIADGRRRKHRQLPRPVRPGDHPHLLDRHRARPMERIQAEFHDLATLQADGNDFVAYHPVVFHMGRRR